MNVCQALLYHAEQGGFNIAGEPSEILGYIQVNSDSTALRKTLDVHRGRSTQSQFIEERRMQQI